MLFLHRLEAAGKADALHGADSTDLLIGDACAVFDFDDIVIAAQMTALRAVVDGHHLQSGVMHHDDEVIQHARLTGGHEHGMSQPFTFLTLGGQDIEPGHIGIRDLHVLRQYGEAVQCRGSGGRHGGNGLVLMLTVENGSPIGRDLAARGVRSWAVQAYRSIGATGELPDETVYPSDMPAGIAELFDTFEFRRA